MYIALWVCSIFIGVRIKNVAASPLMTEFEWKYFDYDWKSPLHKDWYAASGLYEPRNIIPTDVDRSLDGRVFLTTIKANGVPATLHTVAKKNNEAGPLLRPYPDWSWYEHFVNPCKGIVNVYGIAIDECNRLWVLDTGVVNGKHLCPATLLNFDLNTNKLIRRILISDNVALNSNGTGLLVNPIVETEDSSCESTTVYIADVEGHALLVLNEKILRINGAAFDPEEKYTTFTIANESFHLSGGISGMALSPVQFPGTDRYLFFRPLSSKSMYGVNVDILKYRYVDDQFEVIHGTDVLPSQATAQAFTSDGILLYGLTEQVAIGCWHIHDPLEPEYFKIALTDAERLQFITGMKVIKFHEDEYLLMLSNRFQKIKNNTIDLDEVNFRILAAPIRDLIAGTACDK